MQQNKCKEEMQISNKVKERREFDYGKCIILLLVIDNFNFYKNMEKGLVESYERINKHSINVQVKKKIIL